MERRALFQLRLRLIVTVLMIVASVPGLTGQRSFAKLNEQQQECSVLVYGTTPAGLCAAIAAARRLSSGYEYEYASSESPAAAASAPVCVLASHSHIGGMMTGGLGATDTGGARGEALIGGLASEFFKEVGRLYGHETPVYAFAPSVASEAFENLLRGAGVSVLTNQLLSEVTMGRDSAGNPRIDSIRVSSGQVYAASVYIDATYEGDLMAMANVSNTYGREGSSQYNETLNGRQRYTHNHQFTSPVDPFNHTTGEMLPLVSRVNPGNPGFADKKVTAYNLRLCLTKNATNRVEIQRPASYDPGRWELLRRYMNSPQVTSALSLRTVLIINQLPHGKTDVNNRGPVSTDVIGASWTYPEGSWSERDAIIKAHYQYTHELLWSLGHDPAINETIRNEMLEYGLCADEFPSNDWYDAHWPTQLYVREARRMVGPYVFTQHSASGAESTGRGVNSVGCGSYNFDTHNAQRYPCQPDSIQCSASDSLVSPCCKTKGRKAFGANEFDVINEGDVETNPGRFEIPYDVLLPSIHQASNLLVPSAVSSSHIGFSCLRLEPQWMIIGHSAGTASVLAVKSGLTVQGLNRTELHAMLLQEGQILNTTKE